MRAALPHKRIDILLAKQEIAEQIYRYCRAMDRLDADLGYSVWHEDAEAIYEASPFIGTGRGFIDWVIPKHRTFVNHSHQVTNILIAVDGDEADSESCFIVMPRTREEGGQEMDHIILGRYLDRWSRFDGRWAIRKRQCIIDMANSVPVSEGWIVAAGRRDRHDPSYGLRIARV